MYTSDNITHTQGDAGTPGTDGEKGEKGDTCTAGPKGIPGLSIKGMYTDV